LLQGRCLATTHSIGEGEHTLAVEIGKVSAKESERPPLNQVRKSPTSVFSLHLVRGWD
jgi:hypothetical protein